MSSPLRNSPLRKRTWGIFAIKVFINLQMLSFSLNYPLLIFPTTFPIIYANPFPINFQPPSNLLLSASEIDPSSSPAPASPDSGDLENPRSIEEPDSVMGKSPNSIIGSITSFPSEPPTPDLPKSNGDLSQKVIEEIWDCGARVVSCCDGPLGVDEHQIIGCHHSKFVTLI